MHKNNHQRIGDVQVYSLISCLKTYQSIRFKSFYSLVTGPVHLCAISAPWGAYSPADISALRTYRTHSHLCPTTYILTPD